MNSLRATLVGLSLLALAACGGSSKEADTTPADESLEATPVAAETAPAAADTEADPAAADTEATAEAGDTGAICDGFCADVLACAAQASAEQPSDDEKAQFTQACVARCTEGKAEEIAKAQACATDNKGNCPGLFECLQQADASAE